MALFNDISSVSLELSNTQFANPLLFLEHCIVQDHLIYEQPHQHLGFSLP